MAVYNGDWLQSQTVLGFVQYELNTYTFIEDPEHGDESTLLILDVGRKSLHNSCYWEIPDSEDFALDMRDGEALGLAI